ncbi:hypothetical protein [Cognatilysobacter lacus]|uniref:Uncharacterized protein n=1 Tax=Cognatilysobacter lacus TaxID=1643323 RepID=A0A5D8YWQ9_9GAMM|nr:hypothetical protein [Lysobacter lacus]TZF86869.1 hypothetical protein FW784_11820 [Lysobacter lacus]
MTRYLLACLALALLSACHPDDSARPQAGRPMNSAETALHLAKVQAAAHAGDQDALRHEMGQMNDDMRRAMKLPDASRPIDPESARAAAKRVPGVHSVVWLDRTNLLALVDRNDLRSMTTIDAICTELDPLGDTLAVVVHLQSRVARTGDELETIHRNCQLAEGDRAMLQAVKKVDVIPPEIRAEHAAQQDPGRDAARTRRKADEAAKLLEASTPEM